MAKIKIFFDMILETFALVFIVMTTVGWFLGDAAVGDGGLFTMGRAGLSYESIAQIFISATLLGILRVLLISDLFIKKTLLIWRAALLLLLSFIAIVACIIVFQWFPFDMWHAWVAFIISYLICFLLSTSISLLITKLTDRKYKEQLSDYKAKRGDLK